VLTIGGEGVGEGVATAVGQAGMVGHGGGSVGHTGHTGQVKMGEADAEGEGEADT
jgi:hypothetical protein